jgi:hypothetical protein
MEDVERLILLEFGEPFILLANTSFRHLATEFGIRYDAFLSLFVSILDVSLPGSSNCTAVWFS